MNSITRLCLHDFETVEQIWINSDEITLVRQLPAIKDIAGKGIAARTKVVMKGGETVLVSEGADQIAAYSRWKIAMPHPVTHEEYAAMIAQGKREKEKEREEKPT